VLIRELKSTRSPIFRCRKKATLSSLKQTIPWNHKLAFADSSAYPTGQEIIAILNQKLEKNLKLQVLPALAVSLLGLFYFSAARN